VAHELLSTSASNGVASQYSRKRAMYSNRGVTPIVWLLWLVALFVGSLELGWWFFWHVMA
jgi:hypothetical protein